MSNNEWAVQRRGGEESRENNVIYIGRASFRMEPAPLTADEIVAPIAPPPASLGLGDPHGADAPQAAGEDIEPPYLRLRTLVDETLGKGRESPYPPDLDLTEFATIADNTGVERVRRDTPPPPLPRTLIADVASFPHAMPTAIEPATELVMARKSRLSLSRARLLGWGTLAFCAGLLASAGVRMLAAPSHLGPSAIAATAATAPAPVLAPIQAAAPAAVAAAPVVVAPVAAAAPAVEAPAATTPAPDTARSESPHLAIAASTASVRTRSGAAAQARGQTRARARMRSRGGSTAAEVAGETDAPSSDEWAAPAPAPAARPAHPARGWVDPFAQ